MYLKIVKNIESIYLDINQAFYVIFCFYFA